MRAFADLYAALDATKSTDAKVRAMAAYLSVADPADAAWAVFLLSGQRLKRLLPSALLRTWAREEADIPEWLFDESYARAGDLAETISLLLDAARLEAAPPAADRASLAEWMSTRVEGLRGLDAAQQEARVRTWWRTLDGPGVFILCKLLTGALRVGVSRTLVERALADAFALDRAVVARRLMGGWQPTPEFFARLTSRATDRDARATPYPFYLASPIQPQSTIEPTPGEIQALLGDAKDWTAEWKWDGIRAQVIRRGGEVFLWSRGDENLTARFPEITDAAARVRTADSFVLDGEILAWRGGPLPFAVLQKRIGRRTITERALEAAPCVFLAYDLLELQGDDHRPHPIEHRRDALHALLDAAPPAIVLGETRQGESWETLAELRAESRERGVEGLMLKRRGSPYRDGRVRGDWWKWKVYPHTIDAVLTYAQPGHGRRANLFTDYTFAVWDEASEPRELVTIAKAYSGLKQQEIDRLDKWIRAHTIERFGPVRRVEPFHVFELAFDHARLSSRHKAGVALRFPRISRWRTDKPTDEADTLASLRALAQPEEAP
ncbi:MAG: ATP-dependent DNA ligase [Planctomycetota bacterium]